MHAIHADVPGFSEGTRNAALITRIFDNLQVTQPVERMNWSVNTTGDLFLPMSKHRRPPSSEDFTLAERFARVERQTLRKLPVSGDIVFTIRIYSDPIASLSGLPDGGAEVAGGLIRRLEEFTPEQLAYKGMVTKKDALIAHLRTLVD